MKAFIFDLDGVIVGTDEYHYLAWKQIASEENIYFDKKINDRLRGVGRMESLDIILEKAPKKYTMAEKRNDIYKILLTNLTPNDCFSGVAETLKEIKNRDYKIAIGSSSKNTPFILERIGYGNYFDAVLDGNSIKNGKPDPEVFLKAAERLGAAPGECYVVEDAESGIDAAKAGKFTAIGIGPAANYLKTDISIGCFSDLLKLIQKTTIYFFAFLCKNTERLSYSNPRYYGGGYYMTYKKVRTKTLSEL